MNFFKKYTIILCFIGISCYISPTDYNSVDDNDKSPLWHAVNNGDLEEVKKIAPLSKNVINTPAQGISAAIPGKTPLELAISVYENDKSKRDIYTQIIEILLQNDATLNYDDIKNFSKLINHLKNKKLLPQEPAKPTTSQASTDVIEQNKNFDLTKKYIIENNATAFEQLLEKLSESQRKDLVNAQDSTKNTLLHYAAQSDNPLFAALLLEYGANNQIQGKNSFKPEEFANNDIIETIIRNELNRAHYAAMIGNLDIIKKLVENNSYLLTQPEKNAQMPLSYAVRYKKPLIVNYLLQNEIVKNHIDDIDTLQNTPLAYAVSLYLKEKDANVKKDLESIINSLVDSGANINKPNIYNDLQRYIAENAGVFLPALYGAPPLSRAAAQGDFEKFKKTFTTYPNQINTPDKVDGKTPLFYAIDGENQKIIETLIKEKASEEVLLNDGTTILHYIIKKIKGKNSQLLQELFDRFIQNNKIINQKSQTVGTPLLYAIDINSNVNILQKLINVADLTIKDASKNTVLHKLISNSSNLNDKITIMDIILQKNSALANELNDNNESPLFNALKLYQTDDAKAVTPLVEKLLNISKKVLHEKNNLKETPLSYAQKKVSKVPQDVLKKIEMLTTESIPNISFNTASLSKFSTSLSVLTVVLEGTK